MSTGLDGIIENILEDQGISLRECECGYSGWDGIMSECPECGALDTADY